MLQSYQAGNAGRLLAEEFFDARPPGGYGTQRVLTPVAETDGGASVLRQAIRYHQDGVYDLSLVSFRAYFEDNPVSDDPLPATLAASAAMASGAYTEVNTFLEALPADNNTKLWMEALLALREENFAAAELLLTQLEKKTGNLYPAEELIGRFP